MGKKDKSNNTSSPTRVSSPVVEKPAFENRQSLHVLLIILLPLLLYARVFYFDFMPVDDLILFRDHADFLNNLHNLPKVFTRDAFFNKPGADFYRPVQSVTFMIDAFLGRNGAWMYHITNLAIHILTSVSLYFFLKLLKIKNTVSFFCTLLFSVHPLFSSNIAWIVARNDSLICLPGIWLFISLAKQVQTGKKSYFIFHAFLFSLAVFTKETALLFPLPLLFYYFFILKQPFSFNRLLPWLLTWVFIPALYLFIRSLVIHPGAGFEGEVGFHSFIKNLPAIPTFVSKFLVPVHLSTLPVFDAFTTISGLVLFLFGGYLVYNYKGNKKPVVFMGMMWALLFTIPPLILRLPFASNYFTYLEHRFYLPSIGLLIVLACLLDEYRTSVRQSVFICVYVPTLILLIAINWSHTGDYANPMAFSNTAIKKNPENARAFVIRGLLWEEKNEPDSAFSDYNRAIAICKLPVANYNKGHLYYTLEKYNEAEECFNIYINYDSSFAEAFYKRAAARAELGKLDDALSDLEKAERLNPAEPMIPYRKGCILMYSGRLREAVENFSASIQLNPGYGEALVFRSLCRYRLKDYAGAIDDCDKLIQLNYRADFASNNKGTALLELGRLDESIAIFSKMITENSEVASAHYNRAIAMLRKNDINGACSDLHEAVRLGFTVPKDSINRYCK